MRFRHVRNRKVSICITLTFFNGPVAGLLRDFNKAPILITLTFFTGPVAGLLKFPKLRSRPSLSSAMLPKQLFIYLMLSIYTQLHHPSCLCILNSLAETTTPILITSKICFLPTDITSTLAFMQHTSPYKPFLYLFHIFTYFKPL